MEDSMGRFQCDRLCFLLTVMMVALVSVAAFATQSTHHGRSPHEPKPQNAENMIDEGRKTFRFDTFGDEAFWGGELRLNEAIASSLSPRAALNLGLKVDVDALPQQLVQRIRRTNVDLDNPATTLTLLQLNAVVGLTGFFDASGTHLGS